MRPGEQLEEYVKDIYTMLLNMKDDGIQVQRNVKLKGKSGAIHQVDVYYEFTRAGLVHKVAFECKDHGRPVEKGRVSEFALKVIDLYDTKGVMISSRGYQDGAERVAQQYNIDLKTTADLPSLPYVFGQRLMAVALPDESYLGEPFWVIMELQNGELTGSFFLTEQAGRRFVPLFFSKYHAEHVFKDQRIAPEHWCVRGLPRHSLRAFILMISFVETRGIEPMIMFRVPGEADDEPNFAGFVTTSALLTREYYCGPIPDIQR